MKTPRKENRNALTTLGRLAAPLFLVGAMQSQILSWPVNRDRERNDETALDVVIDPSGNVVAAGRLGDQFAVTKRESTAGGEIWTTLLEIFTVASGEARAVTVDASGDVYAAGYVDYGSSRDLCVVRLDGVTGTVVWYRLLNGGFGGSNEAWDLALYSSGDVFAVGWVRGSSQGTARYLATFKLDGATGGTLWYQFLVGSAASCTLPAHSTTRERQATSAWSVWKTAVSVSVLGRSAVTPAST